MLSTESSWSWLLGECECREGFLAWQDNNDRVTCYQEYLQGPCPDDQQLVNDDDQTVCKVSDCPNNQIRWHNGKCFDPIDCDDEDYQARRFARVRSVWHYFGIQTLCYEVLGGSKTTRQESCYWWKRSKLVNKNITKTKCLPNLL